METIFYDTSIGNRIAFFIDYFSCNSSLRKQRQYRQKKYQAQE
ncbi:hypothetical protein [Terrimonas pollutisoli]|nr:hypothetical protein [Terrimonas sp. H1YJ31]